MDLAVDRKLVQKEENGVVLVYPDHVLLPGTEHSKNAQRTGCPLSGRPGA